MKQHHLRRPWSITIGLAILAGAALAGASAQPGPWLLYWIVPVPVTLIALGAGRLPCILAAAIIAGLGSAGLTDLAWDASVGAVMVGYRLVVLLATFALAWRVRSGWPAGVTALVYPAVLAAAELTMSMSPLGTALADGYAMGGVAAVSQLASVTGVTGISFLMAWVGGAVGVLCWEGWTRRARWSAGVAAVGLMAVLAGGLAHVDAAPDAPRITVAAIHAPSFRGKPDSVAQNLERLGSYSPLAREAASGGARLIVWPEMILSHEAAWGDSVLAPLSDLVRETGATHVVGFFHRDDPRNTARIIGSDGVLLAEYQKTHLVTAMETSRPGTDPAPVVDLDGVSLGVLICNDDVFPDVSRQLGRDGARLVADPTWDWRAVAARHAQITRLRAIENGFAMVRATQGGISQLIDSRGRIVASHSVLDEPRAVLVGDLVPGDGNTVYGRLGDWFAWLVVVGLVVIVVRSPGRRG